ncbi:hypothetical protein AB0M34_09950 [Nocardia sp. NPDC050193]
MNLQQLQTADPGKWQAAVDDLPAAAKDCEEAVAAIHANGSRRLEESWTDYLGDIVRNRISDVTGKLEEIAVLVRGAVTALDTLEDAARSPRGKQAPRFRPAPSRVCGSMATC